MGARSYYAYQPDSPKPSTHANMLRPRRTATKAGISCRSRDILSVGGKAAIAARYEGNDGYTT